MCFSLRVVRIFSYSSALHYTAPQYTPLPNKTKTKNNQCLLPDSCRRPQQSTAGGTGPYRGNATVVKNHKNNVNVKIRSTETAKA